MNVSLHVQSVILFCMCCRGPRSKFQLGKAVPCSGHPVGHSRHCHHFTKCVQCISKGFWKQPPHILLNVENVPILFLTEVISSCTEQIKSGRKSETERAQRSHIVNIKQAVHSVDCASLLKTGKGKPLNYLANIALVEEQCFAYL